MCKVTERPPLLRISSYSKVDTAAAAKQAPSSTASFGNTKRVSFSEVVDVYVIDRLDAFAVRELFYRPSDFRRFRSESCQEILEARASLTMKDPLTTLFRALVTGLGGKNQQQRQPLHQQAPQQRPHEEFSTPSLFAGYGQQQSYYEINSYAAATYQQLPAPPKQQHHQQQRQNCSCSAQARRLSPESLVRELAFAV